MPAPAPAGVTGAPALPPVEGHRGLTRGLLLVLALLFAIAPFATDLYLAAFPQMTGDLGTDETGVQLTLTAFLVGSAAGQLVFGPLSDRFGRVRPLIAGAALCVLASAAAVFAPTVGLLVAARVAQGLGGAAGMVIGRAVVADLVTGQAAARALSLLMIVGGLAPVVAPLVGSLLVDPIGWRGILAVVLALAVVMLVAVLAVVRESHPPARRAAARELRARSGSTARDLRSRTYVGNTVAFAFGFAVMMAYISASPFLYQELMGLGEVQYGLVFGVNALLLAAVSGVSARLAGEHPVHRLLGAGLGLSLAGSAALLLLVLLDVPARWFAVPIAVAVAALGLVLGNGTALALAAVPRAAGSASALLGALQFALAALVTPLVSLGGGTSPLNLAVVMLTSAAVALGGFALGNAGRRRAGVPAQRQHG
ncbi:multidrug effflux MFS transporter [Paenibacillus sp. TRM 82003]|uniref:multidrug effflux MFS transporter n=1 Tax=Kineococcus sp. TRM81007 TaxID=2925831 RepID=UPI001F56BBA5|nr:multidrug effflux MFS transporter [Kineococcus sp. TRM81007]MCI2239978.1 multidrug effflux MFS transporter [Kineococcus sp. TRM81007]MCI3925717.1 multidrug effflux MFS transporter [Paenibacillus sp. TRM 82003]